MISVLALGADPLEIPAEDQDIVRGGGRRLPVGDLVRHEPYDPRLVHVDLGREELRVDRGQGLGVQLVAEIVGRELSDVAHARETFDQDRVLQVDLLERADQHVFHGSSSSERADRRG